MTKLHLIDTIYCGNESLRFSGDVHKIVSNIPNEILQPDEKRQILETHPDPKITFQTIDSSHYRMHYPRFSDNTVNENVIFAGWGMFNEVMTDAIALRALQNMYGTPSLYLSGTYFDTFNQFMKLSPSWIHSDNFNKLARMYLLEEVEEISIAEISPTTPLLSELIARLGKYNIVQERSLGIVSKNEIKVKKSPFDYYAPFINLTPHIQDCFINIDPRIFPYYGLSNITEQSIRSLASLLNDLFRHKEVTRIISEIVLQTGNKHFFQFLSSHEMMHYLAFNPDNDGNGLYKYGFGKIQLD